MKKLKGRIYFETSFTGPSVGAFLFSKDTVLVDAPLRPEDGRAWLSDLHKAGAKPRRLAINLDSHPDRTLGTQTLDAQVLAHRDVVRQIRRRASIFKALKQESGAEWEETPGLSGLRWALPRLTFSENMTLFFDEKELRLEHHPGSSPGACWLISPADKVVFVGDTLVVKEPPFLAQADIRAWLEQLDLLSSKEFRGYTIMAGRGGKAAATDLIALRRFLKDIEERLKPLAKKKSSQAEIDKLAAKLAAKFKGSAKRQALYNQRLRYGLQSYFNKRYHPSNKTSNTD
jgi:glyoxylase-like metal-dependent hydrolase (beta-lactamase superfamily II)